MMGRKNIFGVALIAALTLTSCVNTSEHEYQKDSIYETDTPKKDCYLCGSNPDSPFLSYWGQANIGIFNLNTFELKVCEVNRYDNGLLITTLERYPVSFGFGGGQGEGSNYRYSYDSNRGYADVSVSLKEDFQLDINNITPIFCTDCLTTIMNEYEYKGEYCDTALVDFQGRAISPLSKQICSRYLSDYHLTCHFDKDFNSIFIYAFYCPDRYSELAYDPDETLLDQVVCVCDEYNISFAQNQEIVNFLNSMEEFDTLTACDDFIEFRSGIDSLVINCDGTYDIFDHDNFD